MTVKLKKLRFNNWPHILLIKICSGLISSILHSNLTFEKTPVLFNKRVAESKSSEIARTSWYWFFLLPRNRQRLAGQKGGENYLYIHITFQNKFSLKMVIMKIQVVLWKTEKFWVLSWGQDEYKFLQSSISKTKC